jgi:serine/threonine-protein kinase
LHTVEKQLAGFIGPMARILVKRAASRTTDQKELYSLLAETLDRESDRQAFLGQRPGASKITTMYQSSTETRLPRAATQSANTVVPGCPELTPEVLARAARLLVPYVGPIANVLVKKEARRAKSLHSFYELLAEHVAGNADRARFLRDAGL